MALLISLKRRDDFYVAKARYVLKDIFSHTHVRLEGPNGEELDVFDDRGLPLAPNVVVSVGSRSNNELARLAFEAPREIKIKRGDRYREEIAIEFGRKL